LLANGCNADITDNQGLTAADLAEKCRHSDCAAEIQAQVRFHNNLNTLVL